MDVLAGTRRETALEHDLIRKVQSGAKEEFRPLVLSHQSRVFAAIVRLGIEEQVAKDLTQEVFLKAYLNIASFRFEASFGTWLLRIAINHTKNYFASKTFKQQRQTLPVSQCSEVELFESDCFDTFDREALKQLQYCVSQLPEPLREVLVLTAFEQKQYQEVAEVLGIPIGTVRSRVHAARMQLKRLYFAQGDA